jgi:hypothetical protein
MEGNPAQLQWDNGSSEEVIVVAQTQGMVTGATVTQGQVREAPDRPGQARK